MTEHYEGRRLSLKSQTCTIRYIGTVEGKAGIWLGVEWDDATRGKHNGTHKGKTYFKCRSRSATCASFLRPLQPWDQPRTFLEALREKYIASNVEPTKQDAIYFSSKEAEEVGFDKFSRRQAELRGIRTLVLDRMAMRHSPDDPDAEQINVLCAEITNLDLSGNLFETWSEILDVFKRLPSLRTMNLSGNRFHLGGDDSQSFANLKDLDISNTLLDWKSELVPLLRRHFNCVKTLNVSDNEWASLTEDTLPGSVLEVDLSNNLFTSLSDLAGIGTSAVSTLILKNCRLAKVGNVGSLPSFTSVTELDVRHNDIASWAFINEVAWTCPALKHLRTTGNPLYSNLVDASGKTLATEDGYMLTIARLPGLELLNYSRITDKERLNAETYYLNQIAVELNVAPSESRRIAVLREHPRWEELCKEYGEPASLHRKVEDAVDPNSLTARLVNVIFVSEIATWTQQIPKSFSIYEVMGLVGKRLKVMPFKLRLLLETNDTLVQQQQDYNGPEWWDSDEEESSQANEGGGGAIAAPDTIVLTPGTRALSTYVDGSSATIRIERAPAGRR